MGKKSTFITVNCVGTFSFFTKQVQLKLLFAFSQFSTSLPTPLIKDFGTSTFKKLIFFPVSLPVDPNVSMLTAVSFSVSIDRGVTLELGGRAP